MGNFCNIQDQSIKDLASSINKSIGLTTIWVNQWQGESDENAQRFPTSAELKEYIKNKKPSANKNVIDNINSNQNSGSTKLRQVYNGTILNYRIHNIAEKFSEEVSAALRKELKRAKEHLDWAIQKGDKDAIEKLEGIINEYNSPEGRQAVIRDLTLNKIFENIKQYYEECSREDWTDWFGERAQYVHNEYLKILDNFDALVEEACNIISQREFFKVKPSYVTKSDGSRILDGNIEKTDSEQFAEDEDNDENEDGSKVTGIGINYKARFIDPYTTQSNAIRKIISTINKTDYKGNPVMDDLGNIQKLNSEYVDQCLRDGFKDMIEPKDFNYKDDNGEWHFPALEAMVTKYPWVQSIIAELKHKPELLGSFYSNYRQDYIHYAGQTVAKKGPNFGLVFPTDFNKPVAEDSLFEEAYNNYIERNRLDDDSIYNVDGSINSSNSLKGVDITSDKNIYGAIRDGDIEFKYQVPKVTKALRMLGFNIDEDYIERILSRDSGTKIITKVLESARAIFKGVDDIKSDTDIIDHFKSYYKNIATELGVIGEGTSITSFRDPTTGKDRNSYSAPNYMTTFIKEVKQNGADFLEREFSKDEWFRKNGEWRSGWLRLFESNEGIRKNIDIKEVPSMLGEGYRDWKSNDIKIGLLREFFAFDENTRARDVYGWYITPIASDAPIATFIKMKRITGDLKEIKKQITNLLREVAEQEIYRIDLCKRRAKTNAKKIQNYDYGRGEQFCFFPMFNGENFVAELSSVYSKWAGYKDMKFIDLYNSLNISDQKELLKNAITHSMDAGFQEYLNMPKALKKEIVYYFDRIGLLKGAKDQNDKDEMAKSRLEEYFWNQSYATSQMIEMFVTDLAYYKDEVDFQKRFKQCYAAGMKLNTFTDYGKEFRNNVYIKDQIITSPMYVYLKQSLDEAVEEGRIKDYDRDNILYKFKKVNVADAQAWITPEAMRSILDMMGKWDKKTMDPALERFKKGEWRMDDFEVIWQTIKPFMYTQIQKPDGFGGWLRVPHQNKNSEFLVLAAFNTIAAATKGSSKLKAIHDFMSKNNIDSIQMESAVKCGAQGVIELNYDIKKLNNALTDEIKNAALKKLGEKKFNEVDNYSIFKEGNDFLLDSGKITQEEYNKRFDSIEPNYNDVINTLKKEVYLENSNEFNPEVVHTVPYKDYMIQQPTPQHLIDEEGIFASQIRNITTADLPDDFSITIDGHTYGKHEFIKEFQGSIVANVLQSFNKVNSRFENINDLQQMLLDQVRSNSAKYGSDIINALQLVDVIKDGKAGKTFKFPFSYPGISQTVGELMTSIYKNQVTKQYIKGGNAILVSSWGLTDKLHLEYTKTKDGKRRLAAIQCYLPASSRKFYKPFLKEVRENGETYYELDVKKLKEAGLDKIIGYRIPTENKYSIAPLRVMGFLPQQNGSAIMLPAEITQIAGSDFDIDKMFLMIPEFEEIAGLDRKKLKAKLLQDDKFKKFNLKNNDLDIIFDEIENGTIAFEENSAEMYEFDLYDKNKDKFTKKSTDNGVRKVQYDYSKSIKENTRAQRNNHIIDLIWNMLTSQPLSSKVVSPGNFDTIKLHDRLSQIYNDSNMLKEFKAKFKLDSDEKTIEFIENLANSRKVNDLKALDAIEDFLKDYRKRFNISKNPLSPDTFIYNHRQNMTADKLIGIYANNTSMHLKYQHAPIELNIPFTINGRPIKILDSEFSGIGELITDNCAEFQAASVDGVKDPVLATLLQNENTAKITGLMLRSGLSIAEISYFFNQPSVRALIEETGSLDDYLTVYGYDNKDAWQAVIETVRSIDITNKMLLSNILSEKKNQYNERIANAFMAYFIWAADHLNDITNISRADSPKGAIANNLGGAIIQVRKVDWVHNNSESYQYPFKLSNGVPSNSYNPSYGDLMSNPIATLQAFYTCGIQKALNSLEKYFPQLNNYTTGMLNFLIDNSSLDFLRFSTTAEETINNFFRAIVEFSLNKTNLFGNDDNMSLEQKREYYLSEFPNEFIRIKNSNEAIGNLSVIKKITISKDGLLGLNDSGRLRQYTRDIYMKDLDTLASMGEEGRKLAYDLFMYSYYTGGLYFGPNSFGNLFSYEFKSNFNEMINTMRDFSIFEDNTMRKRLLFQFACDNHRMFPIIKPGSGYEVKQDETYSNIINVPPQMVMNRNTHNGNYYFINYVPEGSKRAYFYRYVDIDGDNLRYMQMPTYLPTGVYNPNYDINDLIYFSIYSNQQSSQPQDDIKKSIEAIEENNNSTIVTIFSDGNNSKNIQNNEYYEAIKNLEEEKKSGENITAASAIEMLNNLSEEFSGKDEAESVVDKMYSTDESQKLNGIDICKKQ